MFHKTQGIVLRQQKISDNKRIVNVFTKSAGRKAFIIYNSKKSKINFFQPFFILNLEFLEKNNKTISSLKAAEIAVPFKSIPYTVEKSSIVFFLTEIIDKIVEYDFIDEVLFDFFKNAIIELDNQQNSANFHLFFLTQLSVYMGIYPKDNYSERNLFFDLREAAFSNYYNQNYSMDEVISRKFYDFLQTEANDFVNIKLSKAERKKLLQKLLDYYTLHFNNLKNLRSLEVLEQVFL